MPSFFLQRQPLWSLQTATPTPSIHYLQRLRIFSSVHRIGSTMRNVFESSLQLPSSKPILQTLGTLYRLPHEKTPFCFLTVCFFCLPLGHCTGVSSPQDSLPFSPQCHTHFQSADSSSFFASHWHVSCSKSGTPAASTQQNPLLPHLECIPHIIRIVNYLSHLPSFYLCEGKKTFFLVSESHRDV